MSTTLEHHPMTRRVSQMKKIIAALCAATMLNLGPCTTDDLKTQLAGGLRTAINGLFNVGVTAFANDVFDVDD
jgi:hypothetical protein